MTIQKTLSIIKPDAVKLGQIESICYLLSQQGLKAVATIKAYQFTREEAETFYKEHQGKPFFESMIQFMISGFVYIQVLEGENAIEVYRAQMGATDPSKAAQGTLRAAFGGKTLPQNAVHGSDSPESAQREIHFFFKDKLIP